MTMREFHGRDAYDGTDTGTDSGADAPERHADDSGRQGRAIVQDAETRTALALAYRQLVEIESASRGSGTPRRKAIRAAIPSPLQAPTVITPCARRQNRTPIHGPRTIAQRSRSVRTRSDGRRRTPTFPRGRETCPMPWKSCRTYDWLSSMTGSSASTR